ncbi:DUF2235 domain-containing protein [Burkholderia sp. Ac-20365]|uniref:T6SS phospholipase effector Tle1-like catalytic domain-containing protein n=1 Tax=Burkholderia sp. Ac-20365 TaxID=2703897 RepID=UPI001F11E481|nr:DUF2235 domain-containing protein [Burkholderia sp. Ac-20365]
MLDDTQLPPMAGLRPLSIEERRQRAAAIACLDPSKKPGTPDCSQTVWVSVFFDGTGNNRFNDTPKLKHSNVARLFLAHPESDDELGKYALYVPGLGTPYPEIGEHGYSTMGLGVASGGDARLVKARADFDKLVAKAKARAKNPSQPIRMINLALFGFSRGAALARAFAIRIAKDCHQGAGGWAYQGHPIRLYFMGLFDTVASAGVPASAKTYDHSPLVRIGTYVISPLAGIGLSVASKDGHYEWAKDLRIPAMVEQCVHYIAAHEVRDSFPLDSVRDGKHYPANVHEVIYPGVHSDVGGGYAPGEQTRALKDEDKLSQVPLLHMYRAARAAGVPLSALEILGPGIKGAFAVSSMTAALFDSYMSRTKASGPVEKATSDHLFQMYIARSYLSKLTNDEKAQARVAAAEQVLTETHNNDLVPNVRKELAIVTADGNAVNEATASAETKRLDGGKLSLREETLARAYEDVSLIVGDAEQRERLLDFFDYLVHDSVAGFAKDFSKLQNWRMVYFGQVAYEPANDWSLSGPASPL